MSYYDNKAKQVDLQKNHLKKVTTDPWGALLFSSEQVLKSLRNEYTHEGQALADIVDNSIEAGATKIQILFDEKNARPGSFNSIAIVDNGHGMEKEYLPLSIGIGSTSRKTNPDGLGCYGMGLTGAGNAYSNLLEVYSRADGKKWYKTFIDLRPGSPTYFDDKYIHMELKGGAPEAQEAALPDWIQQKVKDFDGPGSVVILSDFPAIRRKWTRQNFKKSLMTHLGITYFKMAGQFDLMVDGKTVEYIDPLFLTPGLRGYDLDGVKAIAMSGGVQIEKVDKDGERTGKQETYEFQEVCEVKDPETGEFLCNASIRLAAMPPQFGLKAEFHEAKGTSVTDSTGNFRASIIRDWTGVIVIRNNRVIGVDRFKPTRFGNNDYNIGVEFCFTGAADELFGVTYQKNRISLSQDTWNSLSALGLVRGIQAARAQRKLMYAEWRKEVNQIKDADGNSVRPFELAAAKASKKARKSISSGTEAKIIEIGHKNLEREVDSISKNTGESKEAIHKNLPRVLTNPWKIEESHLLGADFVSFVPIGAFSTRIVINKDHPFYTELYGNPECSAYNREVIGALLTSLFTAMTHTQFGPPGSKETVFPSVLGDHFIKNWSEFMSDHLRELSSIYVRQELSDEDDSPVSETQPN